MSSSGIALASLLRDARLAPLAVGPLPAWLWNPDATRMLWANPAGAAIFGAEANKPVSAQIAEFAATLPENGPPQTAQLLFAGVGHALTCACSRIVLADDTPAILVAAAEQAGPCLSPTEQVRRLLAGSDAPVAVFSAAGKLIHATPAADEYLCGAGWLAALGVAQAASEALRAGHAEGQTVYAFVTIDRIGGGETTLLLATFDAPRKSYPTVAGPYPTVADESAMPQPAAFDMPHIEAPAIAAAHSPADMPASPATEPVAPVAIEPSAPMTEIPSSVIGPPPAVATEPASPVIEPRVPEPAPTLSVTEAPAPAAEPELHEIVPPAPAIQASAPVCASPPAVKQRRHPLRFVWQIDEEGRFTINSEEFVALVGPRTTVALGLIWPDLAIELDLDPDERVARALATRDTWSGLTVAWPVDDYPERLTVELSGLPVFDRERIFLGYRGFGVCRDLAQLNELVRLRGGPSNATAEAIETVENRTTSEAGADNEASSLSTGEHLAFYELSRRLTHRLNSDQDAADRDILQSESLTSPAGDMRQLFDRLPSGVLIYRLDQMLYANPAFLRSIGHRNLDELIEAGGLDTLFIAPDSAAVDAAPGKPFALTLDPAGKVRIEAELIPVHWEGESAHALLTKTAGADVEAPPAEATPPAAAVPTQAELADANAEVARVSTELGRAKAEVAELHSILDTATDGVIVLDAAGQIRSVNRSAEALFGYDAPDLTGRPFLDLFAPESVEIAAAYLDGIRDAGVLSLLNSGREVVGRVRQGGVLPLFVTMGRVGDATDKLCAVFRDLTPWKKSEEELLAAKRHAEKASSAKSDLLAKISHEIRTPLNAIIGFSEVMMGERFGPIGNERYREYLRDIHASGGHLISLINDLLDLSKIEAGKLELTFAHVSVNDLTQQCVAIMQPQANRERIIIRTSLPPGLPQVLADARSVRQIVLNLLSNSIKFTGAGGQVIVSTTLNDSGELVLHVRDNGVGMTETELVTALEPFRQIATTTLGRAGGTGLGLPLTKALAEANGARFHIKSAPKEGTLVEVVFPVTQVLAE
jgi:PAS domain S-box-containing protein